jgi:hypothetical protein
LSRILAANCREEKQIQGKNWPHRKEADEWFLTEEKKVARKWNMNIFWKERDRRKITPYLKDTNEIRQNREMEKIECPLLRKVNMFEILVRSSQKAQVFTINRKQGEAKHFL